MPFRDGTGPWGLGPGTGRGKGRYCGFGYKTFSHSVFRGRPGWLLGLVLPLGTAILRDLLNPSGILRRLAHASSAPKITENPNKARRDAEYSVMDTHSIPIKPERDDL